MQNLELQNVEISAGFSFSDTETGIAINGSCKVDNQSRKVKELNGVILDGDVVIGTVAAHFNDGKVFHTISPYDMDDSVRTAAISKALFEAVEQYDYSQTGAEETQGAEEGAEG